MNSWEKQNVDINGITEEYIFLGIYEENNKESSVLNAMINMSKFSFGSCVIVSGISKKCMHHKIIIQLMKFEIIMLIKNIPRKSIETRIFLSMNWMKSLNWLNKHKLTYIYSIFIILFPFNWLIQLNTHFKVPISYYWLTNMNRKSHVRYKAYTNNHNNEK